MRNRVAEGWQSRGPWVGVATNSYFARIWFAFLRYHGLQSRRDAVTAAPTAIDWRAAQCDRLIGVVMANSRTEFGVRLKEARERLGWSQQDLADRTNPGLSWHAISTHERGVTKSVRITTGRILADALGLQGEDRDAFLALARAVGTSTADAPADAPRFVDREDALRDVGGYLTDGRSPLALIHGVEGIGITRFLAHALAHVDTDGVTILQGAVPHPAAQRPYEPFASAIDNHLRSTPPRRRRRDLTGCAWAAHLGAWLNRPAILDSVAPNSAIDDEIDPPTGRDVIDAVGRYLERVAGPRGTVVILDNLQWAGADALALLDAVVRRPANSQVRIVGVLSSDNDTLGATPGGAAVRATLDRCARDGLVWDKALGSLPDAAARAILDAVVAREDGDGESARTWHDDRARALRASGGVPLALVIYGLALRAGVMSGVPSVEWTVRDMVQRLTLDVDEEESAVLDALAILGWPGSPDLLTAMTRLPEDTIAKALMGLRATGLVTRETGDDGLGDKYAFMHPIVAGVLLDGVGDDTQVQLHMRAATALTESPARGHAALAAYHGTMGGDVYQAAASVERASKEASYMGADAAASRYAEELRRHRSTISEQAVARRKQERKELLKPRNLQRHPIDLDLLDLS